MTVSGDMALLYVAARTAFRADGSAQLGPEIRARSHRRTLPGGDSANGSRCGIAADRVTESTGLRDDAHKAPPTRVSAHNRTTPAEDDIEFGNALPGYFFAFLACRFSFSVF